MATMNNVATTTKDVELGGCLCEVTINQFLYSGNAWIGELTFVRKDTGDTLLYVEANASCVEGLSSWDFYPPKQTHALDDWAGGIIFQDFQTGYGACCDAVVKLLMEEAKVA